MTGKKGMKRLIIFLLLFVLIVIVIIGLVLFFYSEKGDYRQSGVSGGERLKNPAEGLSLGEAVTKFDESFVFYLLYNIGAYELHSPPLSSNTPKIELHISEDVFNANIVEGRINVGSGEIDEEDIIIRTTKEEAVKMMQDRNYISSSFREGKSGIELIAGKLELASKGYLKIYENFA